MHALTAAGLVSRGRGQHVPDACLQQQPHTSTATYWVQLLACPVAHRLCAALAMRPLTVTITKYKRKIKTSGGGGAVQMLAYPGVS